MGTVGLFRYFLEVRPSRGSWHSDRHCTWALDVETLPLVTPAQAGPALPLFALPPFLGGFALAPCGRACVCVGVWVGGGVGVGVGVGVCGCLLGCVVGWSLDSFTSPCFDGRAAKSLQGCMCVRFEMAACLSTDAVLPLRELAGEMPYLLQR